MKVSQHIHLLKIPFKIPISPDIQIDRFVNCFIIEGKQITLIDSGVAGSEKVIFKYIEDIGRRPDEISQILLTHSHPDHIGSAKTIKELTKCKIAIHSSEKNWVEDVNLQNEQRPVPGFNTLVAGSCKIDFLLNHGDILDLGNSITIKVIHCPGHSAGSVSFSVLPDNALISGDAIPVKTDVPIYDNWQTSLSTLEMLENMPYPEFLLSSWNEPKEGIDVGDAISEGFEVIYAVHQAFLETVANSKENDLSAIAKAVLDKMGMPSKTVNPLFLRGLYSHKQNK